MAPVTPKLDQSIAELILEMTTREMLDDVHLLDVDMESSAIPSNVGSEEGKQMINTQTLKPPPKPPRFRKTDVSEHDAARI